MVQTVRKTSSVVMAIVSPKPTFLGFKYSNQRLDQKNIAKANSLQEHYMRHHEKWMAINALSFIFTITI